MKKTVTNNLPLKISAVVLAIVVWFLVVNVSDPIKTKTFENIPITVANASYVESMGLSYQLDNIQGRVTVIVRANSSVINRITENDILVTADLTQIVNMDSEPVMVPLAATCTRYPSIPMEDITVSPRNAEIALESLASKDFVVMASAGETKPKKQYEVGFMQAKPEKITISGPQSIIDKIDKVVAQVDVTGIGQDSVLGGKIAVIDKNQEALSDYQLSYLTLRDIEENSTVSVSVNLWNVKTDVVLEASAAGIPGKGYQIAEVDSTPSKITVVGSSEALALLEENGNKIEIPEEHIDASGKKEDFETKIDITQFLPENIRLATDVSSSVLVKTVILPYGSQVFEMPVANVTSQNLGNDLRVVFDANNIQVRVKGTDTGLAALKPADITGTADLSQFGEGTHTIPIQITLPHGLELVDVVTVNATITSAVQDAAEFAVNLATEKSK